MTTTTKNDPDRLCAGTCGTTLRSHSGSNEAPHGNAKFCPACARRQHAKHGRRWRYEHPHGADGGKVRGRPADAPDDLRRKPKVAQP